MLPHYCQFITKVVGKTGGQVNKVVNDATGKQL